jgi:hypothetical protein
MADIAQPHDRFFKALMASPHAANALFRERLPRELVEELTDAPPEPVETTFVDRLGPGDAAGAREDLECLLLHRDCGSRARRT